MTAPEGPLAENASAGDLEANTRGGPSERELVHGGEYFPGTRRDRTASDASWSGVAASPEPLERLAAAIEQLGRLTALEEQLVREIVRVMRDVVAAREPAFGGLVAGGERNDSGSKVTGRIELVEIRVGPAAITEVYAQPVSSSGSPQLREDVMAWEENLRERSRRKFRRRAVYRLAGSAALVAAALAALVWMLRGL
jgi:hypothetical protein